MTIFLIDAGELRELFRKKLRTISKREREKHNLCAESHKKRIVAVKGSLYPNIKCGFRFSTKQPVATI
jgi:hypothetical protein